MRTLPLWVADGIPAHLVTVVILFKGNVGVSVHANATTAVYVWVCVCVCNVWDLTMLCV